MYLLRPSSPSFATVGSPRSWHTLKVSATLSMTVLRAGLKSHHEVGDGFFVDLDVLVLLLELVVEVFGLSLVFFDDGVLGLQHTIQMRYFLLK